MTPTESAILRLNDAARLILPEIILLGTVCVMFLTGPFLVSEAGQASPGLRHRWGICSLFAIASAALAWFYLVHPAPDFGPFRADQFVWFVRGASLSVGAILVLLLWNQIDDGHSAEAHACLLSILAGVNLTAAANDLIGIFLGLELVSIPTYVLLYLPRRDRAMREATLKYFLLSIFSAGVFLYGVAWLYGVAGTTNLNGIAAAAHDGKLPLGSNFLRLAQVLIIAGLGFRIAAVPFHFYAPDVFQGVTSSVAAMLSIIPKIAGFVAFFRLLPIATGHLHWIDWTPTGPIRMVLAVLAVLTMFGGNLLALRQKNLHRLLAYSSVAHAGYMLTGLAVGDPKGSANGLTALLFYLVIYGLTTIGVFAIFAGAETGNQPVRNESDLAGLSKTKPILAALLAICLFSLTGLPPTAGFLGKLNLFLAAWGAGTEMGRWLAIMLAANAVIGASYYLRIIGVVYFQEPATSTVEPSRPQIPAWIAGGCCAVAALALFVAPQPLWDAALQATSHADPSVLMKAAMF